MLLYVRLYNPALPPYQDLRESRLECASFTLSDKIREDTLSDFRRMTSTNFDLRVVDVDDSLLRPIFAKSTTLLAITFTICMIVWALTIKNSFVENSQIELIPMFFCSFLSSMTAGILIFSRYLKRNMGWLADHHANLFMRNFRRGISPESEIVATINIEPPIPWRPAVPPPSMPNVPQTVNSMKPVGATKEDEDLERFDYL